MDSVKRMMKLEILDLKHQIETKIGTVEKEIGTVEKKIGTVETTMKHQIGSVEEKMDQVLLLLGQHRPERGSAPADALAETQVETSSILT